MGKKNKSLSIYNRQVESAQDTGLKTLQLELWEHQMLPVLELQYKNDPVKFKTYDIPKNADYFIANPLVKIQMRITGITRNDIINLLKDLSNKVLKQEVIDI